jgi:hypothetical protein
VAMDFGIERDAQDRFALRSQQRAARAQADGTLAQEITAVHVQQKRGETVAVERDEHPRETSLEMLAKLKGVVRPDGSVTAGNASGVNDGACALLIGSEEAARRNGLTPRARILGMATAGVAPRIMGIGPAPATQKLLARLGMTLDQCGAAATSVGGRRSAREPQRWRNCAWASARRVGRPARHHRDVRTQTPQRPVRALHDVHRRRTGNCHRDRASLSGAKHENRSGSSACGGRDWRRRNGYRHRAGTDTAGMVLMRTVAMLVNEAADAVNQGVCTASDLDLAMKKGVNYPLGPLEWADSMGVELFFTERL